MSSKSEYAPIKFSITVTNMSNSDKIKIDVEYPSYPIGAHKPELEYVLDSVVKMFQKGASE